MRRRIWLILLAIPLAWVFASLLFDGLIGLFFNLETLYAIINALDLKKLSPSFLIVFLIAIVLFVFLLRILGFLLPIGLSKNQQYGTTKFLRRIQGFCAEVAIILFYFLAIPFFFLSFYGWVEFVPEPSAYEKIWIYGYEAIGWDYTRQLDKASIYSAFLKSYWKVFLPISIGLYVATRKYLIEPLIVYFYRKTQGFWEAGRFGKGGSAHFGGLFPEWALRLRFKDRRKDKRDTLFMGRSLYSRFLNIALTDERGMITIGSPRSGKGTTAIIPNLLTWENSAIVIDPKGENALVTARRRQAFGDVFIIDPFEVLSKEFYETLDKKGSDKFNPFEGLDINSLTIREEINVRADALVIPDTNSKDGTHWDDGGRTVLGGLIAELVSRFEYITELIDSSAHKAPHKAPFLPMIRDLLALDKDKRHELWADMAVNREAGDLARDAGSRIVRGIATAEIQNIISNADKHSEWLSSKGIGNVLTSETKNASETEASSAPNNIFTFAQLKKKPTTVFLVIPPRLLDIHKRFLRLFINLTVSEVSKEPSETKILMLLDEFQQLGKMNEIVKSYRLLAGYNLILWIFAQDWSGMLELYGNDANTFLSSSRAVQVFSLNDPESLEYISKQIGARSMKTVIGADTSYTTPLRAPDEVNKETSLESGQQYILRAGFAPLILERVKYYEDKIGFFSRFKSRRERFLTPDSFTEKSSGIWENILNRFYPFRGLYNDNPYYKNDKKPNSKRLKYP